MRDAIVSYRLWACRRRTSGNEPDSSPTTAGKVAPLGYGTNRFYKEPFQTSAQAATKSVARAPARWGPAEPGALQRRRHPAPVDRGDPFVGRARCRNIQISPKERSHSYLSMTYRMICLTIASRLCLYRTRLGGLPWGPPFFRSSRRTKHDHLPSQSLSRLRSGIVAIRQRLLHPGRPPRTRPAE